MKTDLDRLLGRGMAALGAALLCAVLILSFSATGKLGESYHRLREADLSATASETLIYDDSLYVMIGYGVEIDPNEPNKEEVRAHFLYASMQAIDRRILSGGLIYTMMIGAVLALPLLLRSRAERGRHVRSILLSTLVLYAIYLAAMLLMHARFGLPFRLPPARGLLSAAVGLLCVQGGLCALGCLLRAIRFRKTAAVLAVPLTLVLLLFSLFVEIGLYSPEYIDDSEQLIMTEEERQAQPQQLEKNNEHLESAGRAAAALFELLDPYSGSTFPLAEEINGRPAPGWALAAYAVKAGLWIALPLRAGEKKRRGEA